MAGANTERVLYTVVPALALGKDFSDDQYQNAMIALNTLIKREFAEVANIVNTDAPIGINMRATSDTANDIRDFLGPDFIVTYLGDKPEPLPFKMRN